MGYLRGASHRKQGRINATSRRATCPLSGRLYLLVKFGKEVLTMYKYAAIEYSRDNDSKRQFYNCGFDAYGEQFHNMNATLHYPEIGKGVCLVSYNTPAAFIDNDNGKRYIYYIKSSPTTEKQITRFFYENGIQLPAAKRKTPNKWVTIE